MLLYQQKGANKLDLMVLKLIDYNDQLLVPKLRLNMQEPMFWWETQCSEGGKHYRKTPAGNN